MKIRIDDQEVEVGRLEAAEAPGSREEQGRASYRLWVDPEELEDRFGGFYRDYAEDDRQVAESDVPLHVLALRGVGWPKLLSLVRDNPRLLEAFLYEAGSDLLHALLDFAPRDPAPRDPAPQAARSRYLLGRLRTVTVTSDGIELVGRATELRPQPGDELRPPEPAALATLSARERAFLEGLPVFAGSGDAAAAARVVRVLEVAYQALGDAATRGLVPGADEYARWARELAGAAGISEAPPGDAAALGGWLQAYAAAVAASRCQPGSEVGRPECDELACRVGDLWWSHAELAGVDGVGALLGGLFAGRLMCRLGEPLPMFRPEDAALARTALVTHAGARRFVAEKLREAIPCFFCGGGILERTHAGAMTDRYHCDHCGRGLLSEWHRLSPIYNAAPDLPPMRWVKAHPPADESGPENLRMDEPGPEDPPPADESGPENLRLDEPGPEDPPPADEPGPEDPPPVGFLVTAAGDILTLAVREGSFAERLALGWIDCTCCAGTPDGLLVGTADGAVAEVRVTASGLAREAVYREPGIDVVAVAAVVAEGAPRVALLGTLGELVIFDPETSECEDSWDLKELPIAMVSHGGDLFIATVHGYLRKYRVGAPEDYEAFLATEDGSGFHALCRLDGGTLVALTEKGDVMVYDGADPAVLPVTWSSEDVRFTAVGRFDRDHAVLFDDLRHVWILDTVRREAREVLCMEDDVIALGRQEDHLVAVCSEGFVLFYPILSELPALGFDAPMRALVREAGPRSLRALVRRVFGKRPAGKGRSPICCASL